jgi:transposase
VSCQYATFVRQKTYNEKGQCFIAPFPDEVTKAVQYGNGIKAHIVYLSQYQLLPYKRIQEYLFCRNRSASVGCRVWHEGRNASIYH